MTESRAPRVLVAGAGLIGRWHAYYARRAGARLVGVVEPDSSRHAPRKFGGATFFKSVEEALKETHPDVLHVCVPTESHVRLCRLGLESGAHVLCEKPVAHTTAEVEELISLAMGNGVSISPVHQFVFQRGVQKARRRLSAAGEIVHAEVLIHTAGASGGTDESLMKLVGEVLPHPLSLLEFFSLLPSEDWGVESSRPGEMYARGVMGGTSVSINISAHARPTKAIMQFVGTGGTVSIDLFHGFSVLVSGSVSRRRKLLAPFAQSARHAAGAAANLGLRAMRREPAYPGLLDLIGRVYESIEHGRPLPIPYDSLLAVSRSRDHILGAVSR